MINQALFTSNRDDWETPQTLFDTLNDIFSFTLDPCASHSNAKCKKYYTKEENGLIQDWSGERVFVNPPYGKDIGEWARKCYLEKDRAKIIVALLPARTDTRWWHDYIENYTYKEFLKGRVKFETHGIKSGGGSFS